MNGWKTKIGALLIGLGQTLGPYITIGGGTSEIPIAAILTGLGAALSTWGIAHKLEKATEAAANAKKN